MRKLLVLAACVVLVLLVVATWSWSGRTAGTSATSTERSPRPDAVVETGFDRRASPSARELEAPPVVDRASAQVVDVAPPPSGVVVSVVVHDRATKLPVVGAEIVTPAGARAFTGPDGTARVALEPPESVVENQQGSLDRDLDTMLRAQESSRAASVAPPTAPRRVWPTRWRLATVRADRHASAAIEGWTGVPLQSSYSIDLDPLCVVRGRVVDARRAPVAGAAVVLDILRPQSLPTDDGAPLGPPKDLTPARKRCESEQDGHFSFEGVPFGSDVLVRVVQERVGTGSADGGCREGVELDLGDVVLAAVRRIAGELVTGYLGESAVEPLARTELELAPVGGAARVDVPFDVTRAPEPVVTDADGRFAFEGLLPQRYQVRLHGAGDSASVLANVDLVRNATEDDLRLFVARATTLRGIVVDPSGAPVQGAFVTSRGTGGSYTRTTGADGRFEIEGHGRKPVRVEVRPAATTHGLANTVVDSALPDAPEVRITLPRSAALKGRVLEENGSGSRFAAVTAVDANGREVGFVYTDENGRFELFVRGEEAFGLVAQPSRQTGNVRSPDPKSDLRARAPTVRAGASDVVLRMKPGG